MVTLTQGVLIVSMLTTIGSTTVSGIALAKEKTADSFYITNIVSMIALFVFLYLMYAVPPRRIGNYYSGRVMLLTALIYIAPIVAFAITLSRKPENKAYIGNFVISIVPILLIGIFLMYCKSLSIKPVIDCDTFKKQNLPCADLEKKIGTSTPFTEQTKKAAQIAALRDAYNSLNIAESTKNSLGIAFKNFLNKANLLQTNTLQISQTIKNLKGEIEKTNKSRAFQRKIFMYLFILLIILITFLVIHFFSAIKSFFTF
jgi:hypothetical protein